jgi:hypothetical protein
LPILDIDGHGTTEGSIIEFSPDKREEAYARISKMEPDDQYYCE